MREILDDQLSQNEILFIKAKVGRLEDKYYYRIAILYIVVAMIVITSLLHSLLQEDLNFPLLAINTMLVILHVILIVIAKKDRFTAFLGGMIVFAVTVLLSLLFTGRGLIGGMAGSFVILICYAVFLYDTYHLNKLKGRISL